MQALFGPMRLPFIILAISCVVLGASTAIYNGAVFNWWYFGLALLGGLAAHISVNAFNEYEDFTSGLDLITKRTPFSGGSGALPQNPSKAHYALYTAVTSLILTIAIGIYFLLIYGLALLPIGLIGIIIIVAYSKYLVKNPFLCLVAPGLGFGPLMVIGTSYVMSGHFYTTAFWASLIPFCLVNNLLLLNQYPDIKPDITVGRNHVLISLGERPGAYIYSLFLLLSFVLIFVFVIFRIMPWQSASALVFMVVPALFSIKGLFEFVNQQKQIEDLLPSLKMNVLLNLCTPVLLAIGMFIKA